MKHFVLRLVKGCVAVAAAAVLAIGLLGKSLPDTFYLPEGEELQLVQMPWLCAKMEGGNLPVGKSQVDSSQNATLALWGAVPVKTVRVVSTERRSVMVSGAPFGIKMFCDGALVVGFSDILGENGYHNPAREAGIELGDRIISVNEHKVRTNDDLTDAISDSPDGKVEIVFIRGDEEKHVTATAGRGSSGSYKMGMWVRDSSAGIGTLTFYDADGGIFAGLGHAISDSDTGKSIALLSGEIVPVNIIGCESGAPGMPGELKGQFLSERGEWGEILKNETQGVYGILKKSPPAKAYEVALAQEIQRGDAQILSTIEGGHPRLYDVEIEYIALGSGDPNKNMVIRVKDKALLETSGGIVQGMSGSPILQNGRLVGAVTHVLVKDPTRGYGIFAEKMLEAADEVRMMNS